MAIKKAARPVNLPGVHPGLMDKISRAEEAELRGEMPKQADAAQKILRPSVDVYSMDRLAKLRTTGLIDPKVAQGADRIAELAKQAGFMPGVNLDEIWDSLSENQKIRAGAVERFRLEMDHTIDRALKNYEPPHEIGGRLDARNLDRSSGNLHAMVDTLSDLLAPDSQALLKAFIDSTEALFKFALRQNAVAGIDGPTLFPILADWVKKMVYQELASRQAAMGDRGIRRICANIELADTVYSKLKRLRDFTPRWQLLMRLIHVHQDIGYTAYAARVSYRGTKMHRAYGARIFTDEVNLYRALFNHKERELARFAVATHAAEEFPFGKSRVVALVRAVDHLAPVAPHRVYLQLQDIPGSLPYLDAMLDAMQAGDWGLVVEQRALLAGFLIEAKVPTALVGDIYGAFRAFDRLADPVDLGQLGGDIKELRYDANQEDPGCLTAEVYGDPFAQKYQVLFDYQQDQLMRLARKTGVQPDVVRTERELTFKAEESGALVINRTA